jgi:hypothetical protein
LAWLVEADGHVATEGELLAARASDDFGFGGVSLVVEAQLHGVGAPRRLVEIAVAEMDVEVVKAGIYGGNRLAMRSN